MTVEGKTKKARLELELENGPCRLGWNIVADDGHPIEGEINFELRTKDDEQKIEGE